MRRILFHIGMLAGITGIFFFGAGFLSLLAKDPVLTALLAAHGPNARTLALVLLWADTLLSLTVALGSALMGRSDKAPTRRGPLAAALGYLLILPTFAWAGLDAWNAHHLVGRTVSMALPGLFCLVLGVLCLIQWRRAAGLRRQAGRLPGR